MIQFRHEKSIIQFHVYQEAVELHLEDENMSDLGLAERPSVLVNLELPALAYA